jgi:hypothetical protein
MWNIRIPDLPPFAKLFVGIFTTLMVLVCVWAVAIFTVEEGLVGEEEHLGYFTGDDPTVNDPTQQGESDIEAEDTATVLAPIWDSDFVGREIPIDSLTGSDSLLSRLIELLSEVSDEE